MGKVSDKVAVTVSDKSSDSTTRRITIEIEAGAKLFSLSDLLAKEEAIEPLLPLLKRAAKKVVIDYIQSGKQMLKAATTAATVSNTEAKQAPPKKHAAEQTQ